jgi:hypothetical protein
MSGGGGGLDIGKEFAQLDKDLSLSQNAPLIASATATYFGVPLSPVEMGAILGAGRAIDKGSISEGINWGLQGYGGASLGAAASSAFATPTPTGGYDSAIGLDAMSGGEGAAVPVTTATPVPVNNAAVPGAPVAGGAAAPGYVQSAGGMYTLPGEVAAGGGAAPAATPGLPSLFDQATTAYGKLNPVAKYGIPLAAAAMLSDRKGDPPGQTPYDGPLSRLKYDPDRYRPLEVKPPVPYTPVYKDYRNMAGGGFLGMTLEQTNQMGDEIAKAFLHKSNQYATPPLNYDPARYDPEVGTKMVARPGMAGGGLADLGGYADYAGGGRMLKGPGDGMSDSIPATIAGKQPARLANDEFVVPADVVSHLGNGSSDAGAKQLYRMMDKVRSARTGKKSQAKQINPTKYMPA